MKITENVSFNIASEASYVYILSGQKLIKMPQNGPFRRVYNITVWYENMYNNPVISCTISQYPKKSHF